MTDPTERPTNRWALLRAQANYSRTRLQQRVSGWWQQMHQPEQYNATHFYGDIAWFGIANGIMGTYTGVFAIRLGASDALVGLMSSLPALINILWQIPAGRLVQKTHDIKGITVKALFLQRILWLVMALMPFVLLNGQAEAVVALVTLLTIPAAVGGIAFTTLFANSVTADQRGSIVSVRNMLLSLTGMITVLIVGRMMDRILFPYNYQIFFGVAFVTSMFSLYHVNRVKPLNQTPKTQAVPIANMAPTAKTKVPLKERLLQSWRALSEVKEFRDFTIGCFAFNWGIYFPMALYGLYRVNELGASDFWLGLLSTSMSAVQIIMYVVWGRVLKKSGSRWLVLLGAFGLAGFPLFTGLSTRVEPLLLVSIWGAFFNTAYGIGHFDAFMAACPSDRLPTMTATYNMLINITAFVGPLIGTAVAGWIGIRYALILSGVFRLIGAFVMSRMAFGSPPPDGPGFIRREIKLYLALWKQRRENRRRRNEQAC